MQEQLELLETDWRGITKPATNKPPEPMRHLGGHAEHQMHGNSLAARVSTRKETAERKAAIIQCLTSAGHSMTDRQILNALFPGREDMNLVRGRISDLKKDGILREVGSILENGRPNRLVWFAGDPK